MLTTLLLALAAADAPDDTAPRPNIVLILSDDMGYSDIGCYGGEIDTPTLDGLAASGLRLTQFYNTGRCCPTRASLLTGLYPHASGVGHMQEDRGHPGYAGNLNDRCVTIGQALQGAGYRTAAVGKWHVSRFVAPDGPKFNWPLQRGFDSYYGMISGAGSFWDPWSLTRGNDRISAFADPDYAPATDSPEGGPYYFTDAISDHAVRAVTAHANSDDDDRPLFLYVAYTAAHWPMHARERDIAAYAGRYDAGYDAVRTARLAKMKSLGLLPDDAEMSPAADASVPFDPNTDAKLMEIYAAMVTSMDRGIGRLVAALDEADELDDTLILFCQDNGGCAETLGRRPRKAPQRSSGKYGTSRGIVAGPRPEQPTYEPLPDDALIGAMIPPQTRDGYPIRGGADATSGQADTYIAYGRRWANVSNTPFREYKHYVHEGGIATPLIAHWPTGIAARGKLDHTPSHLVDIMATCLDLAGADYAKSVRTHPKTSRGALRDPAGVSLAPLFAGGSVQPRQLYWEHESNRAIREGRWKLVAKGQDGPWELYDIDADRSELHDVIAEHPDLSKRLAADWTAWAKRDDVLPLGQWKRKAKE